MVKEQRWQEVKALPADDGHPGKPVGPDGEAADKPAGPLEPRYEKWTRETLYAHARSRRIAGRSSMSKQQLIEALRKS
ncbi:MAG: hypothetical protein JNM48_02430 [Rhodospirillales bacterium]|nr:hypothetical protein [Rhodospirillales bacterium]